MSRNYLNNLYFLKYFNYFTKRLKEQEILNIYAIKNSMNNIPPTEYNSDHLNIIYK